MITRNQIDQKVRELIKNKNLYKHCLAVETAMRAYARHFGIPENEHEKWGIVGLVHDADWEAFPDKHPTVITAWLEEVNAPEDVVNAVAAHGFNFGIPAKTLMAKTIRAVDELTGLIVAVSLVKGGKITDVTPESVLKKWNVTGFARGVNREDIDRGAEAIGINRFDHVRIVLKAMQGITRELELS